VQISRRAGCYAELDAAPRHGRCRRRYCAVVDASPWRMRRHGGCIAVDEAVIDAPPPSPLPRRRPIPPPSPLSRSPPPHTISPRPPPPQPKSPPHATRSPLSRSGGETRLTPSQPGGTASLAEEMGNDSLPLTLRMTCGSWQQFGQQTTKRDHVHDRCTVGAGDCIAIARDRTDGPRACDEKAVLS
jgi:hypothetical protein